MEPHYHQLEMEGEIADEESNKFLPSNEPIQRSTDAQHEQNIPKYSKDRPNITNEHDINDESNHSTDDDNNDDDDETTQMAVTVETKEDYEPQALDLGMPGKIYRQITDGTWTIHSLLQIMGKIYIHNDQIMFQKSPHNQISHQHDECNNNTERMIRYSELPQWHSFNMWIPNGYRNCQCFNTRECVKSIIQNHNECGNIWTEFIPGFIFIAIFIYQLLYNPTWILYIFSEDHDCDLYFRYAICYWINFMIILIRPFISGCAHWFHPISRNSYNRWWKADYISIVWATMASAANFAICEFFCNFAAFGAILFLLVAISAILTVVIAGSNANENTGIKEKAMVLMLCFEFWGSFFYSTSVLIHSWRTNNEVWKNEDHFEYYMFWFLSVMSSWIAAVFRVTQIPERCIFKSILKEIIEDDGESWKEFKKVMSNPDRAPKDKLEQLSKYLEEAMERDHLCYYYFTSHQFWHVFVNISVAFQMFAWVQYFRYREALTDPCC